MFYYISFLRPPPAQASLAHTEPILITPQICNDLRTEYFQDTPDIHYSWALLPDPHRQIPSVITRPAKLTSWRSTNAYKEITVPRPQNLRDGQFWQLILSVGTTRKDQLIPLYDEDIGRTPFPVMSMPILFTSRPQKTVKQEQIIRSYLLCTPTQETPAKVFDICEQTSFDLDKKVWDSGIGLSSWLIRLCSAEQTETNPVLYELRRSLLDKESRNIVELGAGTGIVAITLSILRSTLDIPENPGRVLTTDLPSAMPLLRHNISANRSLVTKVTPEAAALDWEDGRLPDVVESNFASGLDAIIMADVTYNTASFSALISTLERLLQFSRSKRSGQSPLIVMGYKERDAAERTLWDMAREVGINFEQVAEVKGAGGSAIEIWVGKTT
ncbi:putative methyltransferase-domain-containing protein [Scleroderma yunnanense]